MIRALFILFCLCLSVAHGALKDRLLKASPGDFIVTSQGATYSVLLLRDKTKGQVTLEEITVESDKIDLKKHSWKKWVESRGPGAGSWVTLTIDLEKNQLVQCFSYLQNQWLFLDKNDDLFTRLLDLPLQETKEQDRKKVGPPPQAGEVDRRKLWKPELFREGKKIKSTDFAVLRGTWPSDGTRIAGCTIEVYLDGANSFPFPYWIEIQSPHYTLKIQTVDSGSGLLSPMPPLKRG